MESVNFDIYCSIWLKFAVKILHLMSVNIYEFLDSRRIEDRTFLMRENEITRTHIPLLIVKNALRCVIPVVYVTR